MDTTKTRKIEFKVRLDLQQQQVFEHHSQALRFIWNTGLACIQWREWWEKWQQVLESPDRPGYCPEQVDMGWGYNLIGKKKVYGLCCDRVRFRLEKEEPVLGLGEWIEGEKLGSGKRVAGYWVAYPAKPEIVREHWAQQPRLPLLMKNPYMALRTLFAKKNWDADSVEGKIIHSLNTAWVAGECKALGDAWSSYKSGVRKRPRFKKRHEHSNLINPSSKQTKFFKNSLTLPGMGRVTVKGLDKRWGNKPACPIALIKEGRDFYLQLTGAVDVKPVRSNGVAIGIDPGSVHVATDDHGKTIEPPRYGKKAMRRIQKLQASINRKLRLNSDKVHDPENPEKFYLKPNKNWKRKNLKKVRAKIQRLSAKVSRSRRAFNHFHSTRLVQSADTIVLEGLELKNVTRAVKKGESGVKNGRKAKAGLNKNLLDNAIGQLYGMIEQKAKDAGKVTARVNPFRTSQTCNRCGFSDAGNRPSQAVFHCQKCHHYDNADRNAALNIKRMGILGVTKLTFDNEWNITIPGWVADDLAEPSKPPKPVKTADTSRRKALKPKNDRAKERSKPKTIEVSQMVLAL